MSLRSLLSSLNPRSRQECSEEAGLVISKRLKDLLASADGQLNTAQQPTGVCAAYSEELVEIESKDSNSPALKTAAWSGEISSLSCDL